MARTLRLEAEGGVYHVLNRGNYRRDIFGDEKTRHAFLKCLREACEKTGWVMHAWCIMSNHYHLAVETPRANLVAGMRWLQGTFSTRFNRLRTERGHLFQGRYKSLIVDPAEGLGPLCHYIHLNPVRAKLCTVEKLAGWKWSSYAWLMQPGQRASWFDPTAALQHAGGLTDTPAGRRKYADYLAWLAEDEPARKALHFDRMSKGWVIGTKDFRKDLAKEHRAAAAALARGHDFVGEINDAALREEIDGLMRRLGKTAKDVANSGKSEPWKLAIAATMKARTTATNRWLTGQLRMGNIHEVSRKVNAWMREPDASLARKLRSLNSTR